MHDSDRHGLSEVAVDGHGTPVDNVCRATAKCHRGRRVGGQTRPLAGRCPELAEGNELELGGLVDDVDQHPNPHRQRPLVEIERRLMQVELVPAA
jgi:hypothetical protein